MAPGCWPRGRTRLHGLRRPHAGDRRRPHAAFRAVPVPVHAVHGAARRDRLLGRSGVGPPARRLARGRGGRDARARADDAALGRDLPRFLSLARRRRDRATSARRCSTCCGAGIESNQVGTAEFVGFARRVGAEPLIAVNFESDGRQRYRQAKGSVRTADAREAADWVRYCNDPASVERRAHGHAPPHAVRYWQIGNETSYDRQGFDLETAAIKTAEFARAMRGADPVHPADRVGRQRLGPAHARGRGRARADAGVPSHVQLPTTRSAPVLRGEAYRRDAEATWRQLMKAWEIERSEDPRGPRAAWAPRPTPLAMTECHFTVPGRDRGDVNSTWATGVAYARILNNHQRHGDVAEDRDRRRLLRHPLAEQRGHHSRAARTGTVLVTCSRSRALIAAATAITSRRRPRRIAIDDVQSAKVRRRRPLSPRVRPASRPRLPTTDSTLHVAQHPSDARRRRTPCRSPERR